MSNPSDSNFQRSQPTDCSIKILRFKNSHNIQRIQAAVDCAHFGIFGVCYPHTQETVQKLCESEADRFYSDISYSHELGQQCVDIVLFGLNTIPNVKAWQTPSNSIADVIWKWDVIIEFENNFYPLQIKSSFDSIDKCQELLDKNISNKNQKLSQEIESIHCKYDKIIERVMQELGYKNHKNDTILEIKEQRSQKTKLLVQQTYIYSHIRPLFLWASRNEKALQDITSLFSNLFAPTVNPEELLQAAWISYHEIYQTAKDILLTEQQKKYNLAKSLKACLEKNQQTYQQYLETKRSKNSQEQRHINFSVKVEEILLNNLLEEVFKLSSQYESYCEFFLSKIEKYEAPKTFPKSLSLILENAKQQIIKIIKSQQEAEKSQQFLRQGTFAMRRGRGRSLGDNFLIKSHHVVNLNEVNKKIEKIDKFHQKVQFFNSEEIELMTNCITQLLELTHYF